MPFTYSAMWFGWFAILGLPLGSGFMSKDLILERLLAAGLEPSTQTPDEFAQFVRAQNERFGAIARQANIKTQ